MPLSYYCDKCMKFVLTTLDIFNHPHLGTKSCLVCRRCGGMVYLKTQEEQYA